MTKELDAKFFINFGDSDKKTSDRAKKCIQKNGFVIIKNFGVSKEKLLEFSCYFGNVIPKADRKSNDELMRDVKIDQEIKEVQRFETQNNGFIGPHTARSFTEKRPKYFFMNIMNSGIVNPHTLYNGQCLLTHVEDLIASFKSTIPSSNNSLHWLEEVDVGYKPDHFVDQVANEPLLWRDENGYAFRYWEEIVQTCGQFLPSSTLYADFMKALINFDTLVQSLSCSYEYPPETKDLIILDNEKVAHARYPFQLMGYETKHLNPRYLVSLHVG